jgi:hypothetical protein
VTAFNEVNNAYDPFSGQLIHDALEDFPAGQGLPGLLGKIGLPNRGYPIFQCHYNQTRNPAALLVVALAKFKHGRIQQYLP